MRYLEFAGLAIAGLLFFVWPIPHTISIRYASIFIALVIFGYLLFRKRPTIPAGLLIPAAFYAAITAWMLLAAFFISGDTAQTLNEIRGQWLMGFVAGVIAVLIALTAINEGVITQRRALMIIFSTLIIHILYIDIVGIIGHLTTGSFPNEVAGFTEGRDKSSYLTNHLLMILGAEFFYRSFVRRRGISLNSVALAAVALLTLFSVYLEGARNGYTAALLSCLAILAFYLFTTRLGFKRVAVVAALFVVLVAFGYNSFRTDPRWQTLKETIPLALDTETNMAWLNQEKYETPRLKSGEKVAWSNYERIAWFKEGIKLVAENPLGIGFNRQAFGRALKIKFGEKGGGHSHSGLIDFAVGAGIPGLAMWCAFLGYLMATSIRRFIRYRS